jgi:hypothetical protein
MKLLCWLNPTYLEVIRFINPPRGSNAVEHFRPIGACLRRTPFWCTKSAARTVKYRTPLAHNLSELCSVFQCTLNEAHFRGAKGDNIYYRKSRLVYGHSSKPNDRLRVNTHAETAAVVSLRILHAALGLPMLGSLHFVCDDGSEIQRSSGTESCTSSVAGLRTKD